jgi:acetyl esterase
LGLETLTFLELDAHVGAKSLPKIDASSMDTESYKIYAEGPWLTRKRRSNGLGPKSSKPRAAQRTDCFALVGVARSAQAVPPTLIVTTERDVLRDEGEIFAYHLMSLGVQSVSTRYNGAIHDFMLRKRRLLSSATRAGLGQATQFLSSVFENHGHPYQY